MDFQTERLMLYVLVYLEAAVTVWVWIMHLYICGKLQRQIEDWKELCGKKDDLIAKQFAMSKENNTVTEQLIATIRGTFSMPSEDE